MQEMARLERQASPFREQKKQREIERREESKDSLVNGVRQRHRRSTISPAVQNPPST